MVMEEQQLDMELDSEKIPVPQVQKTTEESRLEVNNKVTSISRGKPRLRKKALHAAIVKQMEFYFSDANLSKDRFLGNLIREDPYVDLSVFITFNKIRDLTTETNRIAKALQASTILSLSEDGTKVRRVTPIMQKQNTDECTIYVQNLPPDADHDLLSSIFSQYGSVAYVSMPRYKSNKKIKGFAFVEFDTPENAKKCIKCFQKKGYVLPSHTSPDELLSITTFDDTEKDVTVAGKPGKSNGNNECMKRVDIAEAAEDHDEFNENKRAGSSAENPVEDTDKKKAKKRKHKETENLEADDDCPSTEKETDTDEIKNKIKKVDSADGSKDESVLDNSEGLNDFSEKSSKRKRSVAISEEEQKTSFSQNDQQEAMESRVVDSEANEEQEATNDDKKKKRKRKRRSKAEDISFSMGLQVMAKKDWKHLRNKYLELQRSKMKQLKQHLKKTRWNQWSNYEKNKTDKEESNEKEKVPKQESTIPFVFTPGVIIKIEMDKPCTDVKNFKMELRGNNSIKYIDVEEGSYHAYVRCETPEAANLFAQKSDEEKHMMILQGEEERMYWDKITHDREEKLGKKVRIKQRGRNKLLKKAEKALGKHIKFDEV